MLAGALIIFGFLCTLAKSCMRTLTLAEISRFHPYHPHTAARLDYFFKRKPLATITIDLVRYAGIFFGFIVATPSFLQFTGAMRSTALACFVLTYILLHSVAEALGKRFREPLAFLCIHPLSLLAALLTPVTIIPASLCRAIDHSKTVDPELITTDIKNLAQTAAAEHAISLQQAHLIARSIELSGITAADIMVKRTNIKVISDTATLTDALIDAHLHHHTRFPLAHNGDIDQIIGYVNFKDIVGALRINPADPTLTGIKRPIESVPATMPLPELLQQLTRGFQHIVVVTDQFQTTLGMVTLEDLMEMLVGNLEDEYDNPPVFVMQLTEQRFCAGGGTPFTMLRKKVSASFPEWDLTINDWMGGLAKGDIPDLFSATYQNCTFTVRKVARGKVFDVIIDRNDTLPT